MANSAQSNQWDHVVAHKMHGDCSRVGDDGRDENYDGPAEIEMERIADAIAGAGVVRLAAVRASRAVYEMQSKRADELAQEMGAGTIGAPVLQEVGSEKRIDLGDRLRSVLSKIWEARDSRLELGCLFIAMDGHGPLGAFSMRQMAESHGVSPEAVSVKVAEFQVDLGLPKTAQQKSEQAVESYRKTNGAPKRARITKK